MVQVMTSNPLTSVDTRPPLTASRLTASHDLRDITDGLTVGVICKNPSKPDDWISNSTFGGMRRWAESGTKFTELPIARIEVANLFGHRATDNECLSKMGYLAAVVDGNDEEITSMVRRVDLIIAAWGDRSSVDAPVYSRRIAEVLDLVGSRTLHRVGTLTTRGNPRHPARNGWAGRTLTEWHTPRARSRGQVA
jgi:hypothetical protein